MKQIEDEFQHVASRLVDGRLVEIDDSSKVFVDHFFALWSVRAKYRDREDGEYAFNNVTGDALTKNQEEQLEAKGVVYLRTGVKMPMRMLYGLEIQRNIDIQVSQLSAVKWGVVRTDDGEFLVPDHPPHLLVPVSPTIYLNGDGRSGVVTPASLSQFNQILMSASKRYYFAHDLSRCIE